MTSHLEVVEWSREVAVLTQTEVVAIGTYETSSYDRSHVATDALILVVSSQPICQ